MANPYDILGVSTTASTKEIKRAFHKTLKMYHPDLNPGDASAALRTREVIEAYAILTDSSRLYAWKRNDSYKREEAKREEAKRNAPPKPDPPPREEPKQEPPPKEEPKREEPKKEPPPKDPPKRDPPPKQEPKPDPPPKAEPKKEEEKKVQPQATAPDSLLDLISLTELKAITVAWVVSFFIKETAAEREKRAERSKEWRLRLYVAIIAVAILVYFSYFFSTLALRFITFMFSSPATFVRTIAITFIVAISVGGTFALLPFCISACGTIKRWHLIFADWVKRAAETLMDILGLLISCSFGVLVVYCLSKIAIFIGGLIF